jgi:hypothetical protein
MINFSHVSYINQDKQVHVSTHIYHMCNILFVIMLEFLFITNIATFDANRDGHI